MASTSPARWPWLVRCDRAPARVFAFVVLTLNPFLLDFFSLCRGYGLACGFTLVALWSLHKNLDEPRIRPWLACAATAAAAMAVLSNLSFLVFFVAFTSVLCLAETVKFARQMGSSGTAQAPPVRSLLATLSLQGVVAAALCSFAVPIAQATRTLNRRYVATWRYDAATRSMLEELSSARAGQPVRLGGRLGLHAHRELLPNRSSAGLARSGRTHQSRTTGRLRLLLLSRRARRRRQGARPGSGSALWSIADGAEQTAP